MKSSRTSCQKCSIFSLLCVIPLSPSTVLNPARLYYQCREQKEKKTTFLRSNVYILIWGVDALELDHGKATEPQIELPGRREGKLQRLVSHIWPLNYTHPFLFHLLKIC